MNTAGDITKQRTNVADALRIALGIKRGTNGRATADAADEAYIMTDGAPTAGDLVDPDVLLSWFKERNRLARLRLHVVTFQTIDTDLKFLQALASAGGGAFVAIPAKSR
jgi:Mg-chelatase subunit ChlD